MIDLGIGEPNPSSLPLKELRQASAHRLGLQDTSCLQYGPEEGSLSFREALAGFLSRHYKSPVRAEELLITAGASHALDLILSRLCEPGDVVWIEDPTYFFALDVFRDRDVRLVAILTDDQGLDLQAVERRLAIGAPRLLYTIPVFHNPLGVTLSSLRRRRLLELARQQGFLVVADEVYQLTGDPLLTPPPLRTVDSEVVLSLGSFSKILGPGVRLGWIEGPPALLARLRDAGVLRSGGGVSPVMAAVLESAIRLGLQDAHLSRIRALYARQRAHAISLLRRSLPPEVRFTAPDGGYYVWLVLPGHVDTTALAEEAAKLGVAFRPGPVFSLQQRFANCLRLCFTYYDEATFTTAIERLASLLRPVVSRELAHL